MYVACCYNDNGILIRVRSITMIFSCSMLKGPETIIEQMIKMMTTMI